MNGLLEKMHRSIRAEHGPQSYCSRSVAFFLEYLRFVEHSAMTQK